MNHEKELEIITGIMDILLSGNTFEIHGILFKPKDLQWLDIRREELLKIMIIENDKNKMVTKTFTAELDPPEVVFVKWQKNKKNCSKVTFGQKK